MRTSNDIRTELGRADAEWTDEIGVEVSGQAATRQVISYICITIP
jgi:hypothetical protein